MTRSLAIPDPARVADIVRMVAADEILPRYEKLEHHEVSSKQAGEIVTAVDIASEHRLAAELTILMPGSVVVGEEGYAEDRAIINRLSGPAPVWILDPLDGTRNYSEGKPCFAVIVALAFQGETRAGWIYDPLGDDMIWGIAGEGVWDASGGLALPRPTPEIAAMRGSLGKRPRERLAEEAKATGVAIPREMVRYQCVGREYMDLVRGKLDFLVYGNLKPWDHAAGVMLHAEAGGHGADAPTGKPYRPGPIQDGRLIMAPDETSWRTLRDLLDSVT